MARRNSLRNRGPVWAATLVGLSLLVIPAFGQEEANRLVTAIAPYLDEQAILVAHLDLSRIDIDAAVASLQELVPLPDREVVQLNRQAAAARSWVDAFRTAGGRDVFAVLSLDDIRDPGREPPVFVVVPVADRGDPEALIATIPAGDGGPFEMVDRVPDGGPLVAGRPATIDRLRQMRAVQPRHLAAAFATLQGFAVQVLVLPNDEHRRVVSEMFPRLPKPLAAIDGTVLAEGVRWVGLGLNVTPEFDAQLVIGSGNADAAQQLAVAWKQGLDAFGSEIARKMSSAPATVPGLVALIDRVKELLQPRIERDRVRIALNDESLRPIIEQVLIPAVGTARQNAQRMQRMNQFKQLALAMHVWHNSHQHFPPSAICDEQGQPLLSWRVAVLPQLEQQELYQQFHLDEPWDSEHNRKLINRMPPCYQDPELTSNVLDSRLPPGHTTYAVPVGEGLVFDGQEGVPIQAIKDGTSMTIMLVEVAPEDAVPWTKPADWEVDPDSPFAGVKRMDRGYFTAGFCDGSVRVIENDTRPEKLWKMLTRAGGEAFED